MQRKAGVVLPLFSIRTRHDWGIGQITDLVACAGWLERTGHRLLQILPPHELSTGETSPYGALTAFGIDPIYADIDAVVDLDATAVDEILGEEGRRTLERVRAADRVDYDVVRPLKMRALRAAYDRFHAREWERGTARAARLADFIQRERAWLDDLALYSTLREAHGGWGWASWPPEERDRSAGVLAKAREDNARRVLEVAYMQWTLLEQWRDTRARMREMGVDLMGDLPFIVGAESADVWSHASQFQLHIALGAPPDDFSSEGQDWGLPAYDWLAMEADELAWIRARARHAGRLYDRFRLDHVVGYFRQWVKRKDGRDRGRFDPEGSEAQRARGKRVLGAMLDELTAQGEVDPPRVIAEDLGVVPPFAREVLQELGMPGYRVLPWEKGPDGRFRDAASFPANSVASWSTHDTPPIGAWWDTLPEGDRAQLANAAGVSPSMDDDARTLALLRHVYGSSSDLALVLIQELLGTRDRINTPATVGPENWTWRLPRPVEDLERDPRLVARFDAVRRLVSGSGR
ncbi:MAG TPA: 4-alpha-glucanotransferase [Polyangiaceae bacterium]|nr:4-alpha-glucanotransferase [Polyangiaceae bacterium]